MNDIKGTCDECDQKELCPVYMGQECLLVKEHNDSIAEDK